MTTNRQLQLSAPAPRGDVILVTGASRGIVRVIAERFAAAWVQVYGTSRNSKGVILPGGRGESP